MKKIKYNNIAILSYGRKGSTRCPNKLLRKFDKTTVVDIILKKFEKFEDSYFGGYDKEFKKKCENHGVNFLQRSLNSVSIDYPIKDCLHFIKNINADYILLVNSCLPFLSLDTINNFLEFVIKNNYNPATVISEKKNYFFNKKYKPINFSSKIKTLNTKTVKPVYEYANALYFFNKNYFFRYGKYWNWDKVKLFSIANKIELLDIDTEEDFKIAESVWKNNNEKRIFKISSLPRH